MEFKHLITYFGILLILILQLVNIELSATPIKVNQSVWIESRNPFEIEVAERFALSHNYTKDYNCDEYSSDLRAIYLELGINATIMQGNDPFYWINKTHNVTYAHQWIKVEHRGISFQLEPQTGELIDYSDEYIDIKELD
ncbi:MAG: hypothetical protein ABIJ08_05910 [Nanoarchaeota archaeon]